MGDHNNQQVPGGFEPQQGFQQGEPNDAGADYGEFNEFFDYEAYLMAPNQPFLGNMNVDFGSNEQVCVYLRLFRRRRGDGS